MMDVPTAISIERVVKEMKSLEITLHITPTGPSVGFANINGFNFQFIVLPSVLIVRADRYLSETKSDPRIYLAANEVNNRTVRGGIFVVDNSAAPIMRAEVDICSAAGLTDSQLHMCLSNSVNDVLDLQNSWAKATAI
ncbi:hypothetical protein NY035_10730 [Corynebacterium diphtheriae bv. mitis]|uniref:YbjN domain-containing protein n=2 Tax=Corynebacterium diphtheriae TaxID=1717 RepID=A0A6J4WAH5_CORDP|nr:hypothetical protein [Corynebacterium diphtheriae]AWR16088.1 hypothetical protein B11Q_01406 [Corynebacterium diphtheriae]KLN40008.1 hypothetical protein AL07_06385 [Corynebacterium diphtheriae bv. gravis str. ISS 4060]MCM0016650.1 hypothetical protein [Corynebacterium diphtheriae bv. mitis]MCM0026358.1 hypothetical protein [Corynebacterium diphtheriae bv. mitis]MCM0030222.1 hypothetical protein [Corynebacterium diphtheriae bv. mitis]